MENNQLCSKQFILIWFVNFVIFMSFQILIPTIPLYASEIFLADSIVGLIVGIYTFSAVLIRPLGSYLLESNKRKIYILTGLLLFGVFSYGYFLASSLLIFFIVRLLHGACWGFSTAATSTVASYLIPSGKTSEGMGYFTLSQNIAMAIGPGLGLYIISNYSFHKLFFTSLLLSGAAFLVMFLVKDHAQASQDRLKTRKIVLIERKVIVPSLVLFFTTLVQGAIVPFISLYALSKNISHVGLYFAVFAIVLILTRPFIGRYADRNGSYHITLLSLLAVIIALYLLYSMQSSIALIIAAIFWGIGFGTVHPLMQASAVRLAPNEKEKANGTFWIFFDAGIGMGAVIGGFIANIFDYSTIYLAFLVFPLLAAVMLIKNKEMFTIDKNPIKGFDNKA